MTGKLRLAEALAALSLTTDLGAGVPFEKGLRTCVVASGLAGELHLEPVDLRAVYFASLLRSVGCTAHASLFAEMFDDDVALQRELKTLDLDDPALESSQATRFAGWAGAQRGRMLARRFVTELPPQAAKLGRGSCEVSAALGARLELPQEAIDALDEVYERYDGRGFPAGLAGDQLTVAARVVHLAEQAVIAHYDGGPSAAAGRVADLSGGHLDPELCACFARHGEPILAQLDGQDMLAAALAAEPAPWRTVPKGELVRVCSAFATFADLKGRFLLGHSDHTASLASCAAQLIGLDPETRERLRAAALLLDIGRVGVSSAVWDGAERWGRWSGSEFAFIRTGRSASSCGARRWRSWRRCRPTTTSAWTGAVITGARGAASSRLARGCWPPPTPSPP